MVAPVSLIRDLERFYFVIAKRYTYLNPGRRPAFLSKVTVVREVFGSAKHKVT